MGNFHNSPKKLNILAPLRLYSSTNACAVWQKKGVAHLTWGAQLTLVSPTGDGDL